MATASDDLAHWNASFKRHASLQLGGTVPTLARIHNATTEYLQLLLASAGDRAYFEQCLLRRDAAGAPAALTEVGRLLFQRLFEGVQRHLPLKDEPQLPDHTGIAHHVSGSVALFRELVLLPTVSHGLYSRSMHFQPDISGAALVVASSLMDDARECCLVSKEGLSLLLSLKKQNKRFYDQQLLIKRRLHAYLHVLHTSHPKVYLVRLALYGPLSTGDDAQRLDSIAAHGKRFDDFLTWARNHLGPSLVGFVATMRAGVLLRTVFWDVCLVIDSRWWPDSAVLVELLRHECVEVSSCVHAHFSLTHPVHRWMGQVDIATQEQWEAFWQRYIDQCIDPLLFMRLQVPKDFRVVRSGRVGRKKSKK